MDITMALARSTDNSSNNSCNNSHKRRGSDSSLIDLNRFSSNSEVSDVSSNVAALQPFGAEGFNYSYYIMEDGEHHLPVEKLINYLIKIEQELVLSRHGYRSANNSLSNSLKLNSPVDSCNNSTKGLVDAAIDSKDISVSGNQQGNSSVKNFEMLTAETLAVSTDPELLRILKSYGWAKDHYETNSKEEEYFQASELLQALQNLYLKQKNVLNDMYLQDIAHDLQQFEELTSFCPDTLLVYLQKTPSLQSNDIPCFSFTGACMLADISGFSKFSGEMCQKGVRGLDDLREATNGFLGYFVEVVYEYKGDVIAFAGDALICVFPEADDVAWDTSTPSSEQLNVDACLRALQCACLLKDHHTDVLSTHIAVSYGPMKLALLGGINNQRIHVMNGGCVSDLSACIDAAGPRQVAVTNRCHERALKAFASTNYCGEEPPIRTRKSNKDGTVIIEYVSQPSAKLDRLQTVSPGGLVRKSGIGSRSINLEMENVSGVIQNFVARPVVNAIATQSLSSISELRVVTTMFLSLDTYSPHIHQDPTTLQPFFLLAQEALIVTGGFLRQFLVDDKGCVLIAMWGIPSFAYANNCSRALNCAVRIFLGCLELDHKCSIGLTTGDVFCGCVGSVERRDFAGIGNDVNMAARLMAKAHGRIIVDNNTYFNLSQQSRDLLKSAEPMKLKGAELPVTPYQYASNVLPEISITDELPGKGTLLRRKTREFLVKQLDRLSASIRRLGSKDMEEDEKVNVETTSFIIISGKPGTGKSLAAKYVKHGAMKRNLPCIAISARQSHIGVPYGLMRELFTELVGLANFDTVLRQNETINKLVDQAYADTKESNKELARQSLYFMLGVRRKYANGKEYLQNERYDNLQSEGEPGSITRLASSSREKKLENELTFYKILCRLLENKPTVLIIENAHFSDELSWNTLSLILKESDINILIFTTVRSYKTTIEDEHNISEASLNENKEKKKINKHLTLLKNVQMAVSGFTQALHFKGAKNEEEDGLQISNSSRTDTHKSMNSNNKRNMNSNVYNSVDEKELYPGESGFESTSLSTKKPTKSLKAIAKRVLKSKLSADNIHTLNEKNVEKIPYASNSKSESTDIIAEAISAKAIKERELKRCISTKISIETDEDLKREVLVDGEYVLEDNSSTTATPKKSPSIDLHMREMIFKQNRNISDWISFETLEAYSNIINDHRTTFIEMTGLRSSEVKEILLNVLGIGAVSKDLISLVLDVSSGNAFWCKEIASFIRERGIDEFEQTIQDDDKNRGNMLKNFILSRMEKLATDHQRIVKLAALIGEFTFDLLQRVLPLRLQEMLNDALELLQNRGFILLIDVYPEKLYGFQNQLIETTLAELTPPRDAAFTHIKIAEYLVENNKSNLRQLYPKLAYHYRMGIQTPADIADKEYYRSFAFMYNIKAADQAISRGAYSDGLSFSKHAFTLGKKKAEFAHLEDLLSLAMDDLNASKASNKRLSFYFCKPEDDIYLSYEDLKRCVEIALDNLISSSLTMYTVDEDEGIQVAAPPSPFGSASKDGDADVLQPLPLSDERKAALARESSAFKLNWQASYMASRQSEGSNMRDRSPRVDGNNAKMCCTVS